MRSKKLETMTTSPLCSVEGCDREVSVPSKGWCARHYQRWRIHGDPTFSLRDRDQGATCSVEGCGRRPRAKRLCASHYRKTLTPPPPTEEAKARRRKFFWDNIDQASSSEGCWLWQRKLGRNGYGQMRGYAGQISAHRFAYEVLMGPIPEGMQLDHLCRNRACCNPEHLEPVTGRENRLRGDTLRPNNGAHRGRWANRS
jgi:hypothetical protein